MTSDVKITGRDRIKDRYTTDVAHGIGVGGQLGAFHEDRPDLWVIHGEPLEFRDLLPYELQLNKTKQ